MWYTTEKWAKTSRATKIFSGFWVFSTGLLWFLVSLRIVMDYKLLAPSRITESISTVIGGTTAVFTFTQLGIQRDVMTDLIRAVDSKFLRVPKESLRQKKWWEEARKIYIIEGYLLFLSEAASLLLGASQVLYTMYSGKLFYDAVILISDESYSWPWWFQSLFQLSIVFYSAIYFTAKDFMLIDLFYHVSRLFGAQTDVILDLCEGEVYDPEVEFLKLRNALKETSEIYEYARDMAHPCSGPNSHF